MLIARDKRQNNIAEYIIYMWQIEDLIRAYDFNIDRIQAELVSQYEVDDVQKVEIANWYSGLAESMLEEGLRTKGHLQFLVSLIDDLNDFHFRLVDSSHQPAYQKQYMEVVHNISDFRKKMGPKEKISDMEVCLTALYGLLLMRLKKIEVSEETETVINGFSQLLAMLSPLYIRYEEGKLDL